MNLRKSSLILSASAILSAAVFAPDVALAQPFPGPPPAGRLAGPPGPGVPPGRGAAGLPRPPGVGEPMGLARTGGPPGSRAASPAPQAVVPSSPPVRVALTAALKPMSTAAPEPTATAARTMATGRGNTGTGRLMASMSTAIPTLAAATTPTSTALRWAPTTRLDLSRTVNAVACVERASGLHAAVREATSSIPEDACTSIWQS